MAAAIRILGLEDEDLEAVFRQQGPVLVRIETGMVERLSAEAADRLAPGRPAGEHQRRTGPRMGGEYRKHRPLVMRRQMEEAVPGDKRIERAAKGKRPHVAYMPGLVRHAGAAERDKAFGPVDTHDAIAAIDEMPRERLTRTATDIQDDG